jgi:hypothetical protein
LVLLAALGFLRPTGLPAWLQPLVMAIPFFVLAFGLVFGWFLSRAPPSVDADSGVGGSGVEHGSDDRIRSRVDE